MNNEKVGKIIQEKRKIKKITQEDLANMLHVSSKTISKWETGRGLPSIDMLMPICENLDIELKELLTGEKDCTYEELLITKLKNKKKKQIIELVLGILVCIFLCLLEVVLYIADVNSKLGTIILISFVIIFAIIDITYNYINKNRL